MEKKTTMKEYYNAIITKLNGEDTAISVDDMVTFVESRIAQIDKKSANKKPSKKDEVNDKLKSTIVDILTELGNPATASEILTDNRIPDGTSLPKITSMLTALVKEQVVTRVVDKRKAYFSVTTDETTDETID